VILAREGETISDIAKVYRLSPDKIAQYNDNNYTTIQKLKINTRIYIQAKKDKNSKVSEHIVKNNETMFDIAQFYGIKLDKILQRNRVSLNQQPANGERIYLNSKRPQGNEVRLRDNTSTTGQAAPAQNTVNLEEDGMLDEISGGGQNQPQTQPSPATSTPPSSNPFSTPTSNATPAPNVAPTSATPPSTSTPPAPAVSGSQYPPSAAGGQATQPAPQPTPSVPDGYHLVVKGDTLFSIARKYNITPARLKELNNMTDDTVRVGQTLKIK
jgi:membrane-bound lytic murein transglycosylase D